MSIGSLLFMPGGTAPLAIGNASGRISPTLDAVAGAVLDALVAFNGVQRLRSRPPLSTGIGIISLRRTLSPAEAEA